ncbi:MAG: hypothetical protein QOF48_1566 [Verrucomicrobiota bacterium]|jgi:putative FmdB family regulatory protein
MPTYEYQCEKCGHAFEKFQSMSAKPMKVCPQELCHLKTWGKGKVRKLISSGAGLLFKGSGFYITDYRSENYKTSAKQESSAKETGAKDSTSKETTTPKSADAKSPAAPEKKAAPKPETKPAKGAK